MATIAFWNGQPLERSGTQETPARRRWKPVYLTRIIVVFACAVSLTVGFRLVGIWNLMGTDNRVEARSHIQEEVTHWISQCPSMSAKAYVVACGSIQRGVLKPESWLEAMIEDPSKPVDTRLFICRFTLDSSGSIVDMKERSLPADVPR
jgi:hypothetical protein